LIRKFIEARNSSAASVLLWGTGKAKREFLFVDDLANACVFLMKRYDSSEIINIGSGEDISIFDLAHLVREMSGFTGAVSFDGTKPDGMPRKLLDVGKINALGWKATVSLDEGIQRTIEWCENAIKNNELRIRNLKIRF